MITAAILRTCSSSSTSSRSAQARSFSRDLADRQRPLEPEPRVVEAQAALRLRRVELADLVARLGAVLEHLVAVREPLRHVERAMIVGGQLDRDVLEVRRALRTQVDDDVEDRPARAAHELRLRSRRELEVHPAERPLCSGCTRRSPAR